MVQMCQGEINRLVIAAKAALSADTTADLLASSVTLPTSSQLPAVTPQISHSPRPPAHASTSNPPPPPPVPLFPTAAPLRAPPPNPAPPPPSSSRPTPHAPPDPPPSPPQLDTKTPAFDRDYTHSSNKGGHDPGSPDSESASEYLKSCCPICFGTKKALWRLILCLDANFQLKRNSDYDRRADPDAPLDEDGKRTNPRRAGAKDPPLFSPFSREVPRAELETVREEVETARPPKPSKGKGKGKAKATPAEKSEEHPDLIPEDNDLADDRKEKGMNVPLSTLYECMNSFLAADGDRIKASVQYFDDTGVMALLCHHDIVIYWASMWTAGEKQFYAIALIKKVMSQIPKSWRVGILYDVACQLHLSMVKWGFLKEWFHRFDFGISVFHAYGHQWVCQMWYHPRKNSIWGLSDGEGCERFWSMLRFLIPILRVCGVCVFIV